MVLIQKNLIVLVIFLEIMKKIFLLSIAFIALQKLNAQFARELNVPNPIYKPANFEASWISNPDVAPNEYSVSLFRKTFELATKPDAFIINISADNKYKLYINGIWVAVGPQLGDLRHWKYETLDIAPYLKAGKNIVAVEVANFGMNKFYGIISLRCALMINGFSEREKIINTDDKSWKTFHNKAYKANHPNWMYSVDIVGGFYASNPADSLNGNLYPFYWEKLNYNEANWKTPLWTSGINIKDGGFNWLLEPRTTPMQVISTERLSSIARTQNINIGNDFIQKGASITIPKNTKCSFLVDNLTLTLGYPELITSGGRNSRITLTYAENLFDKNLEKGNRNDIENKKIIGIKDIYIINGGQKESYKSLWFRSFRFVQFDITTQNEDLVLNSYYNIKIISPLEKKSTFKADNPLYDKIMDICWRTASICVQDNLVSDAYYEQMQYVGDSRVHAATLVALTGDSLYLKNALEMFNNSRLPDGNITSCYPLRATFIHPTFSLIWVDMLYDYMMYFGNKAFMRKFIPGIYSTFWWFESNLNENGIPGKPTGSYFVDWYYDKKKNIDYGGCSPTSENGNSAVVTLHYIYTLQNAAKIYTYLDMNEEAAKCTKRADELKNIVQKLFFDASKQMYAEDQAQTFYDQRPNIMAINTGLVSAEKQIQLLDKILKDTSYISEAGYYYRFIEKPIY